MPSACESSAPETAAEDEALSVPIGQVTVTTPKVYRLCKRCKRQVVQQFDHAANRWHWVHICSWERKCPAVEPPKTCCCGESTVDSWTGRVYHDLLRCEIINLTRGKR